MSREDMSYDEIKFNTCDTCANGIVTVRGVECGKRIADKCKPNLLENPKHYINWIEELF